MILNPKETTIAYRCPHCGETVLGIAGAFAVAGHRLVLRCAGCGETAMTLTSQAGKISIDVPCTVCPGNHTYTLGEDIFFGRPLTELACKYTGLGICFIGGREAVCDAAKASDEKLGMLMEQIGAQSLSQLRGESESDGEGIGRQDDAQTFDIVNFILTEREEEHKITCHCNPDTPHDYKFDLVGKEHDTVLIYCDECQASKAIKIGDPIAANAFLHIDHITLE